MINLLPPKIKSNYSYARRNVSALHWLIAFVIVLAGLGAIGATGLVYMQHLSGNYQKQIDAKEQTLKTQKLSETQKAAKDISSSLKLAVTVLGKEVLFSELLTRLGTIVPSNSRLSAITINQTTGALDITATSTDYAAATQLQVNLDDPDNKIFSKADIVNVGCNSSGETKTDYPCTVAIRALFAKNNPFLFINAKGSKN